MYASKNDTLYKIVTEKKFPFSHSGKEKIHCGGEYFLELETLLPKEIMGLTMMPPSGGGPTGINFNKVSVFIEPEKNIWNLFEVLNLNGLYIDKKYILQQER